MARLVETSVDEVQADRINVAKEYASCTGSVVVLKGSGTVIAPPDGDVYVNQTGNDGLATGGSGDVLSGMIAGLLAGGSRPEDAAIASVYIHGHCADIYAKDRDTRSMLPSDILEMLPKVLHSLNES
jgi:NAD(P)H-hydrate epimerase